MIVFLIIKKKRGNFTYIWHKWGLTRNVPFLSHFQGSRVPFVPFLGQPYPIFARGPCNHLCIQQHYITLTCSCIASLCLCTARSRITSLYALRACACILHIYVSRVSMKQSQQYTSLSPSFFFFFFLSSLLFEYRTLSS